MVIKYVVRCKGEKVSTHPHPPIIVFISSSLKILIIGNNKPITIKFNKPYFGGIG
mgnify:CR=1 FL=1